MPGQLISSTRTPPPTAQQQATAPAHPSLQEDPRPKRTASTHPPPTVTVSGLGGLDGNQLDPELHDAESLPEISKLSRAWMEERGSPDILRWKGDVVDGVIDQIDQQVPFAPHIAFFLPSRDPIADSVESVMGGHWLDGAVVIPGCDKNMPGVLIALGRLNRPGIMVYGGTIRPGSCASTPDQALDIVSAFQSYGQYLAEGGPPDAERKRYDIVRNSCPGPGACGGMYNVPVPTTNILGTLHKGASVLMSGLNLERLVLSGGPLGLMQAAFDYALEYAHQRTQFIQWRGEFQLVYRMIADLYTKLGAARAYVYAVARACDAGHVSRKVSSAPSHTRLVPSVADVSSFRLLPDCAGAILYYSDRAVEVTMDAQQILGGNGYVNDFPVGRLLRDARLYTVGAGTQEIRRMLIGREFKQELA
ncbi:unnamed protein product [Tilletia controversa]|nr:unnamed protein product [Tilletia controversa]CAD6946427.1 unnamed protein product [Tilletia controversa]